MLAELEEASKGDRRLAELLVNAREYAALYLMTRKRQKGCDGMGELAMVKEDFRDCAESMLRHCTEKNYVAGDTAWDLDSLAEALAQS